METFFFYFLATVTVVSSFMVTLSRNTINGAMYMILALIATGGLFGMLGSYFLAALQVLVYAGAIMVLFVFIIMMIEVKDEAKKKFGIINFFAALLAAALMISGIVGLAKAPEFMQSFPVLPETPESPLSFTGSALSYGTGLFGKYMLPIQVMGFLLLVAMIGVILITKDLGKRLGLSPQPEQAQRDDIKS
jgi:NADH-quinone oxidoreductase subunit J